MRHSIQFILLFSLLSIISIGCQFEPIEVNFEEITDQGVVIFSVHNHTDQDFIEMDFEVTYLDDRNEVIMIDTLHYEMAEESPNRVFLEANGQTMFSASVPENTASATGRVIPKQNEFDL